MAPMSCDSTRPAAPDSSRLDWLGRSSWHHTNIRQRCPTFESTAAPNTSISISDRSQIRGEKLNSMQPSNTKHSRSIRTATKPIVVLPSQRSPASVSLFIVCFLFVVATLGQQHLGVSATSTTTTTTTTASVQASSSTRAQPTRFAVSRTLVSSTTSTGPSSDEQRQWQEIKQQLAASLNDTLKLEWSAAASDSAMVIEQRPALAMADQPMDELDANEQQVGGARSQLVRQLSRLFMSNGIEQIEHRLGARHEWTRADKLRRHATLNQNNDDNEDDGGRARTGGLEANESGSASDRDDDHDDDELRRRQASGQQQDWSAESRPETSEQANGSTVETTGEPSELVTCLPDYEDEPTLLMDAAASGTNLSAEQQAQLLSGSSDSLGLQHEQHNSSAGATGGSVPLGPARCQSPGARMIEVITKIITPILFGIIIVVGLLGNIIVMLVILEDRHTERELTPANLLILDLSLADLSFIIFCIPFTGWDYAVGHWVFGQVWCKFNQFLIVVCALSSIYTLVLMSIDRFMAIVYPIECINYRTSSNTLRAIVIKWLLIFIIALPTIAMHGLIESPLGPDQFTCRFLADQYNPLHFQIVFFVTSYLSPLVLIFCLYLSLLNRLWFGSKPHGHKESLKMLESKKKVTWLVASIVIVFALCWCPIQIMLILMRLKTHKITATYVAIQVFAHILGYMNSCINPIVYAFASETFNQSFKRSWLGHAFWRCVRTCCCCCCCSSSSTTSCSGTGQTQPGAQPGAGGAGSRSMSLANAQLITTNVRANHTQHTCSSNSSSSSSNNNNNNNNNINNNSNHQHQHRDQRQQTAEVNTSANTTTTTMRSRNGAGSQCQLTPIEAGSQQARGQQNSFSPQQTVESTCCSGNCNSANSLDRPHLDSIKQQLPLEPRDRPSVPPPHASPSSNGPPLVATSITSDNIATSNNATTSNKNKSHIDSSTGSLSGISRTPTSSSASYCEYASHSGAQDTSVCSQLACQRTAQTNGGQQKQQLVARMVRAANGSQQAVAHECEPCTSVSKHKGP